MRPATVFRSIAFALLAVSLSYAQSATLSGPSLGYVWNGGDATLRPMHGILGSATIGDPLDLGVRITGAVALNERHFLASSPDGPALLFVSLETQPPTITALHGVAPEPALAAVSRRGTAAALYDAAQRQALVISDFPASPAVSQRVDFSRFRRAPTQIAVHDDGQRIAFAITGDDADDIFYYTAGQEAPYRVATAATVSALAFASNGDLVVADASSNEISKILTSDGSGAYRFLADSRQGVSRPVGVRVSDGDHIYVANAGVGSVVVLDADGLPLSSQNCACTLTGLHPFQNGVYRLSGDDMTTLFLLQTASGGDRVVFVPRVQVDQ